MLEIKNLYVSVESVEILKGVNLKVNAGEIHAIMGANGAGKSTLSKVIAGHPQYEVTSGQILFKGQDVVEMEPEERAALGLFMSFQYPVEIAGVSNFEFLKMSLNSLKKQRGEEPLSDEEFKEYFEEKRKLVEMKEAFSQRDLNEGFSGGEKKKNEILQMAVLNPSFAILDETDSGLDIDAMRIVASGVRKIFEESKALVLITHYQRLLDYIQPDFVHVMLDGKIVQTGNADLALQLEEKGYDWLIEQEQGVSQ